MRSCRLSSSSALVVVLVGLRCLTLSQGLRFLRVWWGMVLYGSALHLLVHKILPKSPQENLTNIWATARQLYDHFDITKENRYGTLRLTMFKTTGSTKLRGKAGEIRAFAPIIHRLWQQHYNPNLEIHTKIELSLRFGCRMEEILDLHRDEFVIPGLLLNYVIIRVLGYLKIVLMAHGGRWRLNIAL